MQKATGRTIRELLDERFLRPARLTDTDWETEPAAGLVHVLHEPGAPPSQRFGARDGTERNPYAGGRDLARWGQLHLGRGELALPAALFSWVTTVQPPATLPSNMPHHGYFW